DSAKVNTLSFSKNLIASSLTLDLKVNETMPPKPFGICFLAKSCCGCDGKPGYNTFSTNGCCSKNSATFCPLKQGRSTRKCKVLIPRKTKKHSCGPKVAPVAN